MVQLQLALLKGILEVVVLGQHSRTDEPHVFSEGDVGTNLRDGAPFRAVAHDDVAAMVFGGRLQTFAEPLVAVDLPLDDNFRYFPAEDHEVEKLILIEVVLVFILFGSLVLSLDALLQIRVQVDQNGVVLLFLSRVATK